MNCVMELFADRIAGYLSRGGGAPFFLAAQHRGSSRALFYALAADTIASMLRATSSSVVAQEETLILIAV